MRSVHSVAFSLTLLCAFVTAAPSASADEPAPGPDASDPAAAPSTSPPSTAPSSQPANGPEVVSPHDPERKTSIEPQPTEAAPPGRTTLEVDPIVDGTIVAVALGFAGTTELINSTGEIRPQQISPTFSTSQLLAIDRPAVTQTISKSAGTGSNIGLAVAAVFAAADPILSGLREKDVQTGIVDAFMYAEALSITLALTNLTKISIRRPRPKAYIEAEAHKSDPSYSNTDTDSSLSFFSGHSAITATIGGTATYLAFARAPKGSARPWITLGAAVGLTTFVAYERVRAGAHFPTDVIAGALAGAGVGVVVSHLHRTTDPKQRRVWVGYAPVQLGEGGGLSLSGDF